MHIGKTEQQKHHISISALSSEMLTSKLVQESKRIHTPNIGAPQYVRQILMRMKEEINSNTIIVGDFNTPLTTMDRSTKQN